MDLLVGLKVPVVAARKLALDYPQYVRDGVAQARAILARGYRPHNDVGFVLDVVRSYGNGKYAGQRCPAAPAARSGPCAPASTAARDARGPPDPARIWPARSPFC